VSERGVPRCCVIGAGPSGIAAAKHLLQVGLRDVVVYDRGRKVGGNWVFDPGPSHSSVFETTHIISSRTLSEYSDYAFPAGVADYPGHRELQAYFEGYARRFGVLSHIRFGTEVASAVPDGEGWRVSLGDGTTERFDFLLVANGHHWDPRMPDYPGRFTGELLHSHSFKSAAPFRGKRVLVVGGGNSACDIAVETSRVSAFTGISLRRGYYFVPKFLFGIPSDVLHSQLTFIPRPLRARILDLVLRVLNGSWQRYGLPRPDHRFLSSHPVVNSELLYFIRHGEIHPRPDVAGFEEKSVHFVDGRREEYDAVIAATGFRISFPFLDRSLVDFSSGPVPLYLRCFHPRHRSLFFIGLLQPIGCVWPLAELQGQLVANAIVGRYRLPEDLPSRIEAERQKTLRTYMHTARHSTEVDYHPFRKALLAEIPQSAPTWGSLPS
jgi:NADPH-dependent 2,4-dienoyl-CoA reductase/sulfur reductase-like enzyme